MNVFPNYSNCSLSVHRPTDRNLARSLRLQLYMADDRPTTHYHVLAVRIELGTQDFDIGHAKSSECPKHVADKNVLDDALAEG
jgi:hypothetical protein